VDCRSVQRKESIFGLYKQCISTDSVRCLFYKHVTLPYRTTMGMCSQVSFWPRFQASCSAHRFRFLAIWLDLMEHIFDMAKFSYQYRASVGHFRPRRKQRKPSRIATLTWFCDSAYWSLYSTSTGQGILSFRVIIVAC